MLLLIPMLWHRQAISESNGDKFMLTLSNGHLFRVTGLLGNLPVTGEIPTQRPVTRSFVISLICASISNWVNDREASDFRRHRAHYDTSVVWLPPLNEGFEPRASGNVSPAEWMPADKPTELSGIKLKCWPTQPVPLISEHPKLF